MRFLLSILCLCLLSWYVVAYPEQDRVYNLPGLPANANLSQFSGYLNIPGTGKHIHYWAFLSQNNPATDPVVLWSNGGPGCSGGIGLFEEHGPYSPQPDGKTLLMNPYSWNQVATMFYIEAPVGVGFSYSDNPSDYNIGDTQTALDNYHAVVQFFSKFPELKNNDFYISAESYGGHYMPTLAKAIVEGNQAGTNPTVNFKGFMVGNPYTDPIENIIGAYGTFYGHSLIPKPTWLLVQQHCLTQPDSMCSIYQQQATNQVGNLDPYALDYPVCLNSLQNQRRTFIKGMAQAQPNNPLYTTMAERMEQQEKKYRMEAANLDYPYDPCRDNYATVYLNQPAVQAAYNVKNIQWSSCSTVLNYNMSNMNIPMEPVYTWLIQNGGGLKMLVYSGDDDSVCGSLGTQHWIFNMNWNVKADWTTWSIDNQVAGYIMKFDAVTFMTVHSAGHEVPAQQPKRGIELLKKFLSGSIF